MKTKPAAEGIERHALHFVQVVEGAGGVESGLAGGDALGFHVLKGLCGLSQNAVEALLVHAEIYEGLGVTAIDGGGGEGGVDFGMAGIDLGFGAEVAESEHAVFNGAHAVETPLGVDDGLGALALGEGLGSEIDEEFVGEAVVSGEVLGGQDDDAGGQAVAQRVQAGGLLAGFGARTCTLLGVAAVGFELDDVKR